MKKETAIAISAGVLTGVVIAIALITKSQSQETIVTSKVLSISPTITIPHEKIPIFRITEPKNGFVTKKNEITIKGEAAPGTTVVIQSPKDERVFKIEDKDFAQIFSLSQGENPILVTFYRQQDIEKKQLYIYSIIDD